MSEQIPQAQIDVIDKRYWTPQERAAGVLDLFNEVRNKLGATGTPKEDIPTDWDLTCFAVEYLGLQSVALQDDDLKMLVVPIIHWLYSAHYSNPGRLYGEPDRKEEDDDSTDVSEHINPSES